MNRRGSQNLEKAEVQGFSREEKRKRRKENPVSFTPVTKKIQGLINNCLQDK